MDNNFEEIYIIDALRTPVGKLYGALSHIRPDDMGASLIKALITRTGIEKDTIDSVLIGCANQAGEDNRNLARMASLLSSLPYETTAITYNSLCSSGMEAIFAASRNIALGESHLVLCGGIENMSRAPYIESRDGLQKEDSTIGWRFINPNISIACPPLSMPETAEILAKKYSIPKALQDNYALKSRQAYENAKLKGIWRDEVLTIIDTKGNPFYSDEQHRILSLDVLSKLPKLVEDGDCITVGNSAKIGDGGALIALASGKYVHDNNITPIAKIKGWASAACHPTDMGQSDAIAIQKLINKYNLSISNMDYFELSESFAVQLLATAQELGIPQDKINQNGGAIAIGNPIAMGSARLVVSLTHQLKRNPLIKNGIAASCAGLGMGAAIWLENC